MSYPDFGWFIFFLNSGIDVTFRSYYKEHLCPVSIIFLFFWGGGAQMYKENPKCKKKGVCLWLECVNN